eukprot:1157271-Pelagomonas_calceolata.AAC.1
MRFKRACVRGRATEGEQGSSWVVALQAQITIEHLRTPCLRVESESKGSLDKQARAAGQRRS